MKKKLIKEIDELVKLLKGEMLKWEDLKNVYIPSDDLKAIVQDVKDKRKLFGMIFEEDILLDVPPEE